MLLWILFAVLTAAVVIAVTRPLGRAAAPSLDPASADLAVYRDQLAEIEADRDRGLVDVAEAEAARAEVARRLLQRAGSGKGTSAGATGSADVTAKRLALAAAILIPLLSIGLYAAIGSPGLPDQPHATRVAKTPGKAGLPELVAQVEARLLQKPDDGAGWDVIAPVYMIQKRYADAAHAYGRALKLLGESAKRLGGFAEASVLANDGIVKDDARRAYERLVVLEPSRYEARFWLAMAKEQDGKPAEAIAGYREMLSLAPADAPWRAEVEKRLKELGDKDPPPPANAAVAPQSAAPPASGAAPAIDPAAVAGMSPADREAFIGRMVSGLAERLKANGKDLEGWQKLVRAYKVMGQDGAARTALADARRNFVDDAKALAELDGLARSLGLGS